MKECDQLIEEERIVKEKLDAMDNK